MVVLNLLAAGVAETIKTPGGIPWEWLILKVFDFVANYGWRIILFTVLLKLVLLPLDIYQKYCMRKNQKITERLKPEMEKLAKAYGHDKNAFAQKQMELNKREGFSYFSSCLPMILTLVIFIWLWNSMTNISRYMIMKQYIEWDDRFDLVESYLTNKDYFNPVRDEEGNITNGGIDADEAEQLRIAGIVQRAVERYNADINARIAEKENAAADKERQAAEADEEAAATLNSEAAKLREEAADLKNQLITETVAPGMIENRNDRRVTGVAQQSVADFYADSEETNREDFLWIKNIWSPDVPWKKPIGDYKSFMTSVGKYATDPGKLNINQTLLQELTSSDNYNLVTEKLRAQEQQANGYLVLPILAVGLSFLSYFITQRQQKKSGQTPANGPGSGTMKFMMILFPLMMGMFALTYSAAFTLYIVVNSATTIVVNLLSSLAITLMDKRAEHKATATVQRYGRPDPNELRAGQKKKDKKPVGKMLKK